VLGQQAMIPEALLFTSLEKDPMGIGLLTVIFSSLVESVTAEELQKLEKG